MQSRCANKNFYSASDKYLEWTTTLDIKLDARLSPFKKMPKSNLLDVIVYMLFWCFSSSVLSLFISPVFPGSRKIHAASANLFSFSKLLTCTGIIITWLSSLRFFPGGGLMTIVVSVTLLAILRAFSSCMLSFCSSVSWSHFGPVQIRVSTLRLPTTIEDDNANSCLAPICCSRVKTNWIGRWFIPLMSRVVAHQLDHFCGGTSALVQWAHRHFSKQSCRNIVA